jgi:hypothetical protein
LYQSQAKPENDPRPVVREFLLKLFLFPFWALKAL